MKALVNLKAALKGLNPWHEWNTTYSAIQEYLPIFEDSEKADLPENNVGKLSKLVNPSMQKNMAHFTTLSRFKLFKANLDIYVAAKKAQINSRLLMAALAVFTIVAFAVFHVVVGVPLAMLVIGTLTLWAISAIDVSRSNAKVNAAKHDLNTSVNHITSEHEPKPRFYQRVINACKKVEEQTLEIAENLGLKAVAVETPAHVTELPKSNTMLHQQPVFLNDVDSFDEVELEEKAVNAIQPEAEKRACCSFGSFKRVI